METLSTNLPYGPTYGGYTCTCGAFVPFGQTHSCTSATPPATTRWDRMSDVRIADALERIAGALEQIAKRKDTP